MDMTEDAPQPSKKRPPLDSPTGKFWSDDTSESESSSGHGVANVNAKEDRLAELKKDKTSEKELKRNTKRSKNDKKKENKRKKNLENAEPDLSANPDLNPSPDSVPDLTGLFGTLL